MIRFKKVEYTISENVKDHSVDKTTLIGVYKTPYINFHVCIS